MSTYMKCIRVGTNRCINANAERVFKRKYTPGDYLLLEPLAFYILAINLRGVRHGFLVPMHHTV